MQSAPRSLLGRSLIPSCFLHSSTPAAVIYMFETKIPISRELCTTSGGVREHLGEFWPVGNFLMDRYVSLQNKTHESTRYSQFALDNSAPPVGGEHILLCTTYMLRRWLKNSMEAPPPSLTKHFWNHKKQHWINMLGAIVSHGWDLPPGAPHETPWSHFHPTLDTEFPGGPLKKSDHGTFHINLMEPTPLLL